MLIVDCCHLFVVRGVVARCLLFVECWMSLVFLLLWVMALVVLFSLCVVGWLVSVVYGCVHVGCSLSCVVC